MMSYMLNSPELRFPELHRAIETGALERFRTGQPLDGEDIRVINQISNYVVEWPDGSREPLWSQRE
jgi:hypothetical protein